MPFEKIVVSPFDHVHERTMFDDICRSIEQNLGDRRAVVIGNVFVGSKDLDGILILDDRIIVIEMKNYRGRLIATENGEWVLTDDDGHELPVVGGSNTNPYRQVRDNRFKVIDHFNYNVKRIFNEQKALSIKEGRSLNVSAVVVFSGPIEIDNRLTDSTRKWFHITDIENLGDTLELLGPQNFTLKDNELDSLLDTLSIRRAKSELQAEEPTSLDDSSIEPPVEDSTEGDVIEFDYGELKGPEDVRDLLLESLEKSLLGPTDGPEEIINALPNKRYIIGTLHPPENREPLADPTDETLEDDTEEEGTDHEDSDPTLVEWRADKKAMAPSSLGMSFLLKEGTDNVSINVSWAEYIPEGDYSFKRIQKEKQIALSREELDNDREIPISSDGPVLKLRTRTYKNSPGAVSLFLVNESRLHSNIKRRLMKRELALKCIYSPRMEVNVPYPGLRKRGNRLPGVDDHDKAMMDLLYHERREFGVGHGCSVVWEGEDDVLKISTTFMPVFQGTVPRYKEGVYDLDANALAQDRNYAIEVIQRLLDDYDVWMTETFEDSYQHLDEGLRKACDANRERAEDSLRRMREGLHLISEDDDAWSAFAFMNKGMHLQYNSSTVTGKGKDRTLSWRPFQMAFILQNIPAIMDRSHPSRESLDLLWVPTAGGKTEAYLGLVAFTLGMRAIRRRSEPLYNKGVSVLMRYTLRLLTIQQFQRALRLMCALELIRVEDTETWGDDPFDVGLYIGDTPNHMGGRHQKKSADERLKSFKEGYEKNPFQPTVCPWCSRPIRATEISVDLLRSRLNMRCQSEKCPFSEIRIPAVIVDEEIYTHLPPMVIGTIDKFAQLPFNPHIGMLFGHVEKYDQSYGFTINSDDSSIHAENLKGGLLAPPDMIIQDEIHLINGPLGSMAGMYEATIQKLCQRPDYPESTPKYVASTATIRRASDQVARLYGKKVSIFPPPGIRIDDAFFYDEVKDDKARKYTGLFASGIGQKTLLKRVTSEALLTMARLKRAGIPMEYWDPYWTPILYFNTLKDLGGSKTLIEDDVRSNVKRERSLNHVIKEITSNLGSNDLPKILRDLERNGDDTKALDTVLCTNMFSVGVDVPRLGLMIMNGQPFTTSDYVQATGRVGRTGHGLVINLYKWSRARDQSHFESFYDYHDRIHGHVESMTVTPFSTGVVEKAMHAQYVAYLRIMLGSKLGDDGSAHNFDADIRDGKHSNEIIEWLKRWRTVTGTPYPVDVEGILAGFTEEWLSMAESPDLTFTEWYHKENPLLTTGTERGKRTPNSMRDVERSIKVIADRQRGAMSR